YNIICYFFFFFQAEDGIRDRNVTGVQRVLFRSRQEIYSLIRVHGIRTFDALLEEHGKGHGCEICKPTVASILASCWNDYVLKPRSEERRVGKEGRYRRGTEPREKEIEDVSVRER